MSANRRHRRSRVFLGRRARRKNTPERRRQWLARRRALGWFTGRMVVAGDAGGEVTYSAPLDPSAPVTFTNTVGGLRNNSGRTIRAGEMVFLTATGGMTTQPHSDMVDAMLYASGAQMRPPLTVEDIESLVGKDRTARETKVAYGWLWGVDRG